MCPSTAKLWKREFTGKKAVRFSFGGSLIKDNTLTIYENYTQENNINQ